MNTGAANRLQRNMIVMWDNNPDDLGVVREICPVSFYVEWDNGQTGWIAWQDATKIEMQPSAPPAGEPKEA